MSNQKSDLLVRIEGVIKEIKDATAFIKEQNRNSDGVVPYAPEAALKAIWYINNVAYHHSCHLRFNTIVGDCHDAGSEYKHALVGFVDEYLTRFFPRALHTPQELDIYDSKYFWRKRNQSVWYNRPLISGNVAPDIGLYQSYRRLITSSTGFIYGDVTNEFSSMLRPIFEAIVHMDMDVIRSGKIAELKVRKDGKGPGVDPIDKDWIKAVTGDIELGRLDQAVAIPGDIFRHIYPMVPPFTSVIQQTDEYQLYKTTFQICAYNSHDWVEQRDARSATVGEDVLKASYVFEV